MGSHIAAFILFHLLITILIYTAAGFGATIRWLTLTVVLIAVGGSLMDFMETANWYGNKEIVLCILLPIVALLILLGVYECMNSSST